VSDQEQHQYCTNKFIELANQLKKEKIDPTLVSGALIGVDKVVAVYRRTLEHHQVTKKDQLMKDKFV